MDVQRLTPLDRILVVMASFVSCSEGSLQPAVEQMRQAGKEGVFSNTGYGGRPFDNWRFERLCVLTQSVDHFLLRDRKVDIRLHGKGNSKTPWRKAGQPRHLIDVVDSDQEVVNKDLSLLLRRQRSARGRANMAHVKQPGPDSGLGFQEQVVKTL